jgi:phosphoribosylaminoimidazolecarboxamide formyltransferase/IMP cyclohydrolase
VRASSRSPETSCRIGVEVFATDGTREFLAAEGVEVRSVSELTGAEPIAGGQVKTLHPAIYAGILARRDKPEQLAELEAQGIGLIDLVAVNVSHFAPQVGTRLVPIDEAIEMIDVGGAALLRPRRATTPAWPRSRTRPAIRPYLAEIRERGAVSAELRQKLAAEAYGLVAAYHAEVAAYLSNVCGETFPSRLAMVLEKVDDLRYGENPTQQAAFYRETTHRAGTACRRHTDPGLAAVVQRPAGPGRGLRLRDGLHLADCRHRQAHRSGRPRLADELVEAYRNALETDSVSCFGGIVGVNRELDGATAREIAANSFEAVVAPVVQPGGRRHPRPEAAAPAAGRAPEPERGPARLRHRQSRLQAHRRRPAGRSQGRARARQDAAPCRHEAAAHARRADGPALRLADGPPRPVERDRAGAKRVDGRNRGGPGEPPDGRRNRAAASRRRARTAVMASDAYFPFPDGIQFAAQAGVTAIIQPGGSIRDEMAIEVADRHHMAMVFTGRRHFRH